MAKSAEWKIHFDINVGIDVELLEIKKGKIVLRVCGERHVMRLHDLTTFEAEYKGHRIGAYSE